LFRIMTRNTFLKSAAAVAGLAGTSVALAADDAIAAPEFMEIRKYTLKSPEKRTLLDAYLKDAAIPALNQLGVRNVGVFYPETAETYVILRHASLESFGKSTELLADPNLAAKAGAYLTAPATDPIYERVESWLTKGIGGMPAMAAAPKGAQTYQLRVYESHSEKAAKKKIEMFDIGELAIFQRCGLNAVFFGETIVGPLMPNLTYLLAFSDAAAKDQAWNTFRVDPEWAKLKTTPGFTDKEIVSKITNILLVPAPYSQI